MLCWSKVRITQTTVPPVSRTADARRLMLGTMLAAIGVYAYATSGSMKAFCMSMTQSAVLAGSRSS